jgi:diketogulonate reductase-like aldo/keto reductase
MEFHRPMKYKELGKTGVLVSELALGTWRYDGGQALQAGLDLGANFIDTAEAYGSEEVVGRAISGKRLEVFVATKVLPRNFKRRDIIRAAEQSLKRINTDYIDLYQLHWPNYTVPIAETMAAMEELVESGKVRFIGVSNFSVGEMEEAQAALSKSKIVSNQVQYSLIDRAIEHGLLQHCESNGITILAFSPLAAGLANIREWDCDDTLGRIAAEVGKTRAQVALNWCVRHHSVTAIFKANQIQHIRENCAASGWSLSPVHVGALERVPHRRRGRIGGFARRVRRYCLQRIGRNI